MPLAVMTGDSAVPVPDVVGDVVSELRRRLAARVMVNVAVGMLVDAAPDTRVPAVREHEEAHNSEAGKNQGSAGERHQEGSGASFGCPYKQAARSRFSLPVKADRRQSYEQMKGALIRDMRRTVTLPAGDLKTAGGVGEGQGSSLEGVAPAGGRVSVPV